MMLNGAIVRSSSDGVAIRHAFPGLWMTSCFHTNGSIYDASCRPILVWRERNSQNYCIDSNQILLNDKDQQVHAHKVGFTSPRTKSAT